MVRVIDRVEKAQAQRSALLAYDSKGEARDTADEMSEVLAAVRRLRYTADNTQADPAVRAMAGDFLRALLGPDVEA